MDEPSGAAANDGGRPATVPWSGQTLGQRIVTAAWRAVAAHLDAATAADGPSHSQQVATGGAGDLDPVAPTGGGPLPAQPGHDRLR